MKAFLVFLIIAVICYFVNTQVSSKLVKAVIVCAIVLAILSLSVQLASLFFDLKEVVRSIAESIFGEDNLLVDLCLRMFLGSNT